MFHGSEGCLCLDRDLKSLLMCDLKYISVVCEVDFRGSIVMRMEKLCMMRRNRQTKNGVK